NDSALVAGAAEWHDGYLGIAVGYPNGSVQVFHGLEPGCMGSTGSQVIFDGPGLCGMAHRDVNNDGATDIVLVNQPMGYLAVYLSDGVGGFPPTGPGGGEVYVDCNPVNAGLCDFNKDGNEDIWLVGTNPAIVKVMLGDGLLNFEPFGWSSALPADPIMAAVGDLDSDGFEDLAVIVDDGIRLYAGAGDGTFAEGTILASGHGGRHILMADFDKNGYKDIGVMSSDGSGNYALFLNDGASFSLELYPTGQPDACKALAQDFIGNGYPDLVLTIPDSNKAIVLPGMSLNGGSGPKLGLPWSETVGTNPVEIIVSDFNLDSKPDLWVLAEGDNQALTFTGQPDPEVDNAITVISPNGGETLYGDSLVTITWTKDIGVGAVDIQISRDGGGSWETIAYGLGGTSYVWQVQGPSSSDAYVRVRESSVFTNNDVSDASFVIEVGCCIGTRGNFQSVGECDDAEQVVDISDLTSMIDYLFINYTRICCEEEGDIAPAIDGGIPDEVIDMSDLTAMIDVLFITYPALPPCN
ncbi:MAG: VCBS repeat-containing protein, partial [Candidatus Zixiibacteriota bacterium]